jgi:hypothetical protein
VADVFDEVDEELRRDRAEKLWKKYGVYVMAAAVAIVVAAGAYSFWRDHQRKTLEADGVRFAAADALLVGDRDPNSRDRALAEFRELGQTGNGGYKGIARMREAGLTAEKDPAQALTLYRAIAADATLDAEIRRMASALVALLSVDAADRASAEQAAAALQTPGNPFFNSGRESAALAALRAGDAAKARELYRAIVDDLNAPGGMRQRAAEMLAALGS